jgi:site-specific DNA-methyltransferase (adenine-specific)
VKPYYSDDSVTIYHGDCREVLPALSGIAVVATDPPYGVNLAAWDDTVPDPELWLPLCRSIARTVFVTPGNGNERLYPAPDWTAAWFRPGSVQRVRRGTGFSHWEPILIYGENRLSVDAKQIKNLDQGVEGHPCPKPVSVFQWIIGGSTLEGETILDTFMGSGTTLRAAKDLNRKAVGIDINEAYCEVAATRMSQLSLGLGA